MGKRARLKSIDELIEWGKSILSDDDVYYEEMLEVFGEFDKWAGDSEENEQRIEEEIKAVTEKMVKDIVADGPYCYAECRDVMRTRIKKLKVEGKPIRWYWKVFETRP